MRPADLPLRYGADSACNVVAARVWKQCTTHEAVNCTSYPPFTACHCCQLLLQRWATTITVAAWAGRCRRPLRCWQRTVLKSEFVGSNAAYLLKVCAYMNDPSKAVCGAQREVSLGVCAARLEPFATVLVSILCCCCTADPVAQVCFPLGPWQLDSCQHSSCFGTSTTATPPAAADHLSLCSSCQMTDYYD